MDCDFLLFIGPTLESQDDPFVLVGTAHCNYICKDRISGSVLETCCCRPPSSLSSCARMSEQESPFCRGDPVFTLGEPDDFEIVCGEFDVGVQILREAFI